MGLIAALLCTVFAASKDLVSKRLASRLSGNTSTFASFAFALPYYVVALAAFWMFGHNPLILTAAFLQLVFLRALTDTFAEGMKMHALAHGDISLVASFMSLSPVFLLALEPMVTGDRATPMGILGVVSVVSGSLVLLYRPPPGGWGSQKRGIALALAASVFFTLNTLLDTLASRTGAKTTSDFASAVFSGFAVTLLSALMVLPFVLGRSHWRDMAGQSAGLWGRGFLEMMFMVSKLYAVQYLPPSEVSSIMRMALLLSIVGGRVYFKEQDFRRRLVAGILIVAGVILITLLKGTGAVPSPS
jgi:drug/metabolite transporter (DMT)-like permease